MKYFLFFISIQLFCFSDNVWSNQDEFKTIVREKGIEAGSDITGSTVRIAFATPLKQVSDYWQRSIDSFKGRMDELGLSYKVYEFSTKIDESRKLRKCIQLALAENPDYIVVTLNDPDDEYLVSRLLSSDTTKVIVQNVTHSIENWRETPPFLYVGFDHAAGTELLADEYIRLFGGKDDVKYAMMYHVEGNLVSKLRGDHFIEVISEKTEFKLVAEYYTQGNRERAENAAMNILNKYDDLDFIYACSTDIAFGVMDALKENKRLDRVVVNGWGGGANELQSLAAGELDFTVMRMNDDNGVAIAEAIHLDLQSAWTPRIYSGDMLIVTKDSEKHYVNSLKARSFRYSGN